MSFGTQTYGDETYGGSELSISSIIPAQVSRQGGTKVVIAGTFPIDSTYLVRVNGILAYSGVPGSGTVVNTDGDSVSFVVPPIALASVGSLTVEVERNPGGDKVQTSMDVLERGFGSAAFELRRMFPSWYETGPRRLELEPEEQ